MTTGRINQVTAHRTGTRRLRPGEGGGRTPGRLPRPSRDAGGEFTTTTRNAHSLAHPPKRNARRRARPWGDHATPTRRRGPRNWGVDAFTDQRHAPKRQRCNLARPKTGRGRGRQRHRRHLCGANASPATAPPDTRRRRGQGTCRAHLGEPSGTPTQPTTRISLPSGPQPTAAAATGAPQVRLLSNLHLSHHNTVLGVCSTLCSPAECVEISLCSFGLAAGLKLCRPTL